MARLLAVCVLTIAVLAVSVAEGRAGSASPQAQVSQRAVELLHGTVKTAGHSARGRAAVVLQGRTRTLTLRRFRIDPGPKVKVYLVPRGVRGDGDVTDDFRDLGTLKGSKGNQQYRIPRSVDLRRYSQVIFWCVPFTQTLARAQLVRS